MLGGSGNANNKNVIGHNTSNSNFTEFSKNYSKSTKSNVQRDLLEGRLAKEFIRENSFLSALAAVLCSAQRDIYNMQRLIMHSFPEVANEIILQEEGTVIENVGDAILVKKCRN